MVRAAAEPPSFPVMTAAAVAVGQINRMTAPSRIYRAVSERSGYRITGREKEGLKKTGQESR